MKKKLFVKIGVTLALVAVIFLGGVYWSASQLVPPMLENEILNVYDPKNQILSDYSVNETDANVMRKMLHAIKDDADRGSIIELVDATRKQSNSVLGDNSMLAKVINSNDINLDNIQSWNIPEIQEFRIAISDADETLWKSRVLVFNKILHDHLLYQAVRNALSTEIGSLERDKVESYLIALLSRSILFCHQSGGVKISDSAGGAKILGSADSSPEAGTFENSTNHSGVAKSSDVGQGE